MKFLYELLVNFGEWLHIVQLNAVSLYILLGGVIRRALARKRSKK